MREISIAIVITAKRKEKGITQDKLAEYIGVAQWIEIQKYSWKTKSSNLEVNRCGQLDAFTAFWFSNKGGKHNGWW